MNGRKPKRRTLPEFENELQKLMGKVPWTQDYLDVVLKVLETPFACRKLRLRTEEMK